jgi:ATP-binding cassette subfamily B protein
MRMGAIMVAIIAAKAGFGLFYDYKGHEMGAKIERDLRGELFGHYQKLSFNFYDNRNTGELISRMNDLFNLAEVYHHVPEMILINGIQVIGFIGAGIFRATFIRKSDCYVAICHSEP